MNAFCTMIYETNAFLDLSLMVSFTNKTLKNKKINNQKMYSYQRPETL